MTLDKIRLRNNKRQRRTLKTRNRNTKKIKMKGNTCNNKRNTQACLRAARHLWSRRPLSGPSADSEAVWPLRCERPPPRDLARLLSLLAVSPTVMQLPLPLLRLYAGRLLDRQNNNPNMCMCIFLYINMYREREMHTNICIQLGP
jgi:hypothetical protein